MKEIDILHKELSHLSALLRLIIDKSERLKTINQMVILVMKSRGLLDIRDYLVPEDQVVKNVFATELP